MLHALREFKPTVVIASTYQAISGAGKTFKDWPEIVDNVIPYIGGEEAKSGFAPEDLAQAAEEAKKCAFVRVRGLMCIPPVAEGEHGSMPYFEKVHALFVDINAKLYDNTLDILSMGMSGDYEDAVRAGATMVRVGTAIFGARNYTN